MDDGDDEKSAASFDRTSNSSNASQSDAPISSAARRATPLLPPPADQDKILRIREACVAQDLSRITALACSRGGFVNDELRQLAWPLLLGISSGTPEDSASWEKLTPHVDEHQVQLDVDRSFVYYPHNEPETVIRQRRKDLQDIIVQTLRRHQFLCYPQGYHDIVQVLLLVLGREKAAPAVARLTLLRVRDFMLPTIAATVSHLQLLPPLLQSADAMLARHVSSNDPSYALAATLTLYAHHVEIYPDVARLYDFLLATEAVMPIYLFATIIIHRRSELFAIEPGEPEMLSVLQKLPEPLDWEDLIARTIALFAKHPPDCLPGRAWRNVSSYSVLKTTRGLLGVTQQTLEQGRQLFEKHAQQVRVWQRVAEVRGRLWKARRPVGGVGVAVLVALVAWSVRNAGAGSIMYGYGSGFGSGHANNVFGMLEVLWRRCHALMW